MGTEAEVKEIRVNGVDYIPKDPRKYTDKELENKYYEFRKIRDNEICPSCKCTNINTNGGDCYCAECGHKWQV
jgi:hypothetical protein